MRLRRVELAQGAGRSTAILDAERERWVALVPALERHPEHAAAIGDGARDVVAFLAAGPQAREAARELCAALAGEDLGVTHVDRPLLPFAPRALRAFASWERHWVQAARGLQRRYVPAARPVVNLYERLSGRTFPPFRPRRRFYREPAFYMGNHQNFYTDGDVLPWPSLCRDMDYELEFGAVLARPLLNATPAEAEAAVGGFVVLNDLSMRDVQWQEYRGGIFGPLGKTKTFANAMSAELVTADEVLGSISSLRGTVRVNGELWSDTSTDGMQHSLGTLLAYASTGEQLHTGELIASGTLPEGCGLELDRWLRPGDSLELEIQGIGRLRNVVGAQGG